MSRQAILILLIPIAYVVGSIPFGLVVGRAKGVDPRKAGSGNIGATNVGRLLGVRYFWLVFGLDLLKGAAPALAAGAVLGFHPVEATEYLLWMCVAAAAVLGHLFSIFLRFKGGKGVATSAGIVLGIFPYYTAPAGIGIATFVLAFLLTRYISVASMLGATMFGIGYIVIGMLAGWRITQTQLPLLCLAVLMPLLIIYKHRGNIARLRAGTEMRVARRST